MIFFATFSKSRSGSSWGDLPLDCSPGTVFWDFPRFGGFGGPAVLWGAPTGFPMHYWWFLAYWDLEKQFPIDPAQDSIQKQLRNPRFSENRASLKILQVPQLHLKSSFSRAGIGLYCLLCPWIALPITSKCLAGTPSTLPCQKTAKQPR